MRSSPPPIHMVATGLLIVMTLVYVSAAMNRDQGPVWGYVRAFAEAAMVGGLADWFAVTAIFRHPLGLPIPHTAVIPRNKQRIADALGEFVAVNFLAPEVIAARLKDQNIASALGRQLAEPATAQRIAQGIADALPAIVDLLDDDVVSDFIRRQISDLSRDAHFSAMIGGGLQLMTEGGRHQPVVDAAIAEGWRALEEHEPAIRAQVRARTSWAWRLISLDVRASDALISAMEETLRDVARDPAHPVRQRLTEMLRQFAEELQNSPALRAQIAAVVDEIFAHPSVPKYFTEVWHGLKEAVRCSTAHPQAQARDTLAEAIERFGSALLADAHVQEALNRRLRALFSEVAGRHGRDVGALISDTIRSWDTKTIVDKLEQNIGPDLQFIRMNGTLIGGIIGLVIHQTTLWLA